MKKITLKICEEDVKSSPMGARVFEYEHLNILDIIHEETNKEKYKHLKFFDYNMRNERSNEKVWYYVREFGTPIWKKVDKDFEHPRKFSEIDYTLTTYLDIYFNEQ